jgi:hypothetical protein
MTIEGAYIPTSFLSRIHDFPSVFASICLMRSRNRELLADVLQRAAGVHAKTQAQTAGTKASERRHAPPIAFQPVFGQTPPRRRRGTPEARTNNMARKPGTRIVGEFVLFDVVYEDGTQRSNRRVPLSALGGLEGDGPARAIIEEQDAEIAAKSGIPRSPIKSIRRSGTQESRAEVYRAQRGRR